MYQEIVRELKRSRNAQLIFGIPLCIAFIIGGIWLGHYIDMGSLAAAVCVLIPLLITAAYWYGLRRLERRLEKMKQNVGASSDAEMETILKTSQVLGARVYISTQYVLNFQSMLAYPRSAVKKIKSYDDSMEQDSRPDLFCIDITVQGYPNDHMNFRSAEHRDKAKALLED